MPGSFLGQTLGVIDGEIVVVNRTGANDDKQAVIGAVQGMACGGAFYMLGETEFMRHFMYPKASGIYYCMASWDDVSHLDEPLADGHSNGDQAE